MEMAVPRKPVATDSSPPQQHSATFESPDDVAAPTSSMCPPLENQQRLSNFGAAANNHYDHTITPAPANDRYSNLELAQDYSGLEFVPPEEAAKRESAAKDGSYYGGHIGGPPGGSHPPYTQFSTLPEVFEPMKEERSSQEGPEANHKKEDTVAAPVGFWKRRICGIRMKIAATLALILLLAIIGSVVGGVLGSRKNNDKAPADPAGTGVAGSGGDLASSNPGAATSATTSAAAPTRTAFLSDEFNTFAASDWYLLRLISLTSSYSSQTASRSQSLVLQANYNPTTSLGNIGLKPADWRGKTPAQHFQLRPVPSQWENSTVRIDELGGDENKNLNRVYWIASKEYGPDVLLSLGDPEKPWTDQSGGRDAVEGSYIEVQMKPRDLGDRGQYWYFNSSMIYKRDEEPDSRYQLKLHNVVTGKKMSLWYRTQWDQPRMGIGEPDSAKGFMDSWDVQKRGVVNPKDNDFSWVVRERKNAVRFFA